MYMTKKLRDLVECLSMIIMRTTFLLCPLFSLYWSSVSLCSSLSLTRFWVRLNPRLETSNDNFVYRRIINSTSQKGQYLSSFKGTLVLGTQDTGTDKEEGPVNPYSCSEPIKEPDLIKREEEVNNYENY